MNFWTNPRSRAIFANWHAKPLPTCGLSQNAPVLKFHRLFGTLPLAKPQVKRCYLSQNVHVLKKLRLFGTNTSPEASSAFFGTDLQCSDEFVVELVVVEQVVVGAAVSDAPVFQHNDLVGIKNGGKSVCDGDHGAG